jgi:cell division protein FtsQ
MPRSFPNKFSDKLAKREARRRIVFEAPTRRPGSMGGPRREGGNRLRAFWNSPAQLGRAAQALFGVAFLLAAFMAGVWAMRWPMLEFRSVQVVGEAPHIEREELARLLAQWRGNFLTLDLERVRRDMTSHAWVKHASVARAWPPRLTIEVVEHRPLAHWGRRALIDAEGFVFGAQIEADLPRLHGPEEHAARVVEHYHKLTNMLAPIGARPVALRLSPRMAWEAELDNGFKLELGRSDFDERMQTFLTAYRVELHNMAANALTVDLRYKRGLALQVAQLPDNASKHETENEAAPKGANKKKRADKKSNTPRTQL